MDFDKCMMTCFHHYIIIQNSFSALQSLCYAYSFPSPHSYSQILIILHLHSLTFSKMSYSWYHKICSLSNWFLSLTNMHVSFFRTFSWLDCSYSVVWTYRLFPHLSIERYLACFQALAIMNKDAMNLKKKQFKTC